MKKAVLFALIILVIGILMTAGCIQSKLPPSTQQNQSNQTPTMVPRLLNGTLNVSIGGYDTNVTLYVDDTRVGEIVPGKPFRMSIREGRHIVKVCLSTACEQIDVEIKNSITSAVDFGDLLIRNIPNGRLGVSIGDYIGKVNVSIDDTQVGEIFPGKQFNISVKEGLHSVKVNTGGLTEQQDVVIKSGKETVVDFGKQLKTNVTQGRLRVTIGGFIADNLPVYLDDISIGNVSQSKPLDMMVVEGTHVVRVCANAKCKNESVDIRFAKQSLLDYSEWLKKEVEFINPTVRIVYSSLNGNFVSYNVEWINPTPHDVTITTTVGVGYSYIESASRIRRNDFARVQLNKYVNANSRTTQPNTLSLSGGSNIMASEPVILDMTYQ